MAQDFLFVFFVWATPDFLRGGVCVSASSLFRASSLERKGPFHVGLYPSLSTPLPLLSHGVRGGAGDLTVTRFVETKLHETSTCFDPLLIRGVAIFMTPQKTKSLFANPQTGLSSQKI